MPTFRVPPLPRPTHTPLDVLAPKSSNVGADPVFSVVVDCGLYIDGVRQSGSYTHDEALTKVRQSRAQGHQAFVWLGLHEPDDEFMASVAKVFGLHELSVEDAVHAHQRPKLERYDELLFLVLKTVAYVPHESVASARQIVETGEIMVFTAPDFVITVRHGQHGELTGVRRRLENSPLLGELGPYAVMYAIADHVVDVYREVADAVEADIDTVETTVFSPDQQTDIESIYLLKREVVELRRAVNPLTFALQRLQLDHNDLLSQEVRRYVRDVHDHNVQAADQIISYDEMLSSLVQAALGKVSMEQNVDMRKISAWVAIAAAPTALAGIYGMNFDNMPELKWHYGYYMILGVMATVCIGLYLTFRRNHWL